MFRCPAFFLRAQKVLHVGMHTTESEVDGVLVVCSEFLFQTKPMNKIPWQYAVYAAAAENWVIAACHCVPQQPIFFFKCCMYSCARQGWLHCGRSLYSAECCTGGMLQWLQRKKSLMIRCVMQGGSDMLFGLWTIIAFVHAPSGGHRQFRAFPVLQQGGLFVHICILQGQSSLRQGWMLVLGGIDCSFHVDLFPLETLCGKR